MVYWGWTVAAYEAEMPMLNFEYGRYIASAPQTYELGAPIIVSPRYLILMSGLDLKPTSLQFIHDFGQYKVWRVPGALPSAFVAAPQTANPFPQLSAETVTAATAHFDGPNRIVVQATGTAASQHLVVLVSDFPGWRLEVDGRPQEIQAISGYLSTPAQSGPHTYTFTYQPFSVVVGLGLTVLTLLVMDGLLWLDARRYFARPVRPVLHSDSSPMLTPTQLTTLRSLLNRIIPADDTWPAAWKAGVGDYLLRQFEGDLKESLPMYQAGLEALDAEAQADAGVDFAALTPEAQDALLRRVETGRVKTTWATDPAAFFQAAVEHATEGYYSDPGNGGNRAGVAWRMIGFTGQVLGDGAKQ